MFSVLLASCTSSGDPNLDVGVNGYNAASMTAPSAASGGDRMTAAKGAATSAEPQGDAALPNEVASLPSNNPADPKKAAVEPAQEDAASTEKSTETAAAAKTEQSEEAQKTAEAAAKAGESEGEKKTVDAAGKAQVIATAAEWPEAEKPAPKKKGFLSSFFGSAPASAAPSPIRQERSSAAIAAKQPAKTVIENRPSTDTVAKNEEPAKPIITKGAAKPVLDLDAAPNRKPVVLASYGGENGNGLPGVRTTALFEIKRKSGMDDDSDIDLHEEEGDSPVILASAGGMARLAPNGLLKQTESVDVACLKPSLVRVLKTIEQRFGKKIIVTSGYRSRSYNMRVRGAKNSQHMYCAAADIQVPGVGKLELANFARSMPGRGGVGTYCHTNSVHVDVGPERDWNWRCRRRG